MLKILMAMSLAVAPAAAAETSATCTTAASRTAAFLIEEAKGTRHEAQIAGAIAAKGYGSIIETIAAGLTEDQCALLFAAPDSTLRAMAITMLPERMGK